MPKTSLVFLVDDDHDDQMIFKEALSEVDDNIKCITAFDCEDALSQLHEPEQIPDYIFLDLNMPGMNGFECLVALKKRSPVKDIPVIVRSTSSMKEDIEKSKRLGAADYVVKSLSYSELKNYLKHLLVN